ncbi:MAG: ABC transporter substrate-binding protein [Aureliella sp.]
MNNKSRWRGWSQGSRKLRTFWGILAAVYGVLLVGCGASSESQFASEDTPEASVTGIYVSKLDRSLAERESDSIVGDTHRSRRPNTLVPQVENSLVIGLDADMSSVSARSGEAIRRGLELAIDEINQSGGLLNRPVELMVRDHRGNPDRGLGNMAAFAKLENLIGVFGGIHTPVAIRELEFIHENDILYFGPWAAGTPVVDNGYQPNNVFRVSVRDEYAGGFLVRRAVQGGGKRIGVLLERTAWGRSNEKAIKAALSEYDTKAVGVEWFNWGERDLTPITSRLANQGCDTILLVCNALEGATLIKAVAGMPEKDRPKILSHWGITGGNFFELTQPYLADVDLSFLQTFSFVCPRNESRVQTLLDAYIRKYDDCDRPEQVFSPVGTAHAYELMLMVAEAIHAAGTIETAQVRASLEGLRNYEGIIRDYEHPFPTNHHDALDESDFILARFDSRGVIVPVEE